jgi:hypothetical protein
VEDWCYWGSKEVEDFLRKGCGATRDVEDEHVFPVTMATDRLVQGIVESLAMQRERAEQCC